MRLQTLLFLSITLFWQCQTKKENTSQTERNGAVIAFGSCSHQDNPDQMWREILAQDPDIWIWGGDNIYGDTEDMSVLRAKYDKQKSREGYQELIQQVPVIGIWDDHDYGVNDGGREYPKKDSSKIMMLEFLDVPESEEVWSRPGAYQAYEKTINGIDIQFILLDTRYFRDSLATDTTGNGRYMPRPEGDFLGEAQWEWLKDRLNNESVDLNVVMSSIQVIPEEHGWEKWANLSSSQDRLFDLITETNPKPLIFLSGDRHIAEISKINIDNISYPVYEFTSSGLSHTWSEKRPEPNRYRVGDLIIEKNYGLIKVNKSDHVLEMNFEVRGKNDTTYLTESFELPHKEVNQ
jgi:alkaline phosphatase D